MMEKLKYRLRELFFDCSYAITTNFNEVTLCVPDTEYLNVAKKLRDHPYLLFDMALDLCAVDYSLYASSFFQYRFAVVVHLLSLKFNWRLRLKTFAVDNDFPIIHSLIQIWPSVNWFEREAFDLFGVAFEGHTDLRRILNDYGFIGHPLRKDFPLSGYVEMYYDDKEKRVVYKPVSIEPRDMVPRVIREKGYGVL